MTTFSLTWRNQFDEPAHEYVHAAAHFVIKEVHDRNGAVKLRTG